MSKAGISGVHTMSPHDPTEGGVLVQITGDEVQAASAAEKCGASNDASGPARSGLNVERVHLFDVPHLDAYAPEQNKRVPNMVTRRAWLAGQQEGETELKGAGSPRFKKYSNPITNRNVILADIVRHADSTPDSRAFVRAGPRPTTYFEPTDVYVRESCPSLLLAKPAALRSIFALSELR